MRRNHCGGAACGEAAGTRSVPWEGWNPVPCVGDGGVLDMGRAPEQGRARDRSRPRQKLSTTHAGTTGPVGRAEPEPAERSRASWFEGEISR